MPQPPSPIRCLAAKLVRMSPNPSIPNRVVYRSAVDRWLALLLIFPIVAAVAVGIVLIAMQRPGDASIMFVAAAATLAVTGIFTVPCRYTLLQDALSIRCGLICYQIAYESIRSVKPGWTLRSAPALSLRRVIVATSDRDHILSPVDRDGFVRDLNSRLSSRTPASA